MSELRTGAGYLRQGWSFLRQRPRLLLLGMAPALLVLVVLTVALLALLFRVDDLVSWATPFADDWADGLRRLVRVLLGAALLVGLFLLFSALFVGLTLIVGDPFYEHIWRATETALGGPVPDHDQGFVESVRDGALLTVAGVGSSLVVVAAGFVPIIGPLAGVLLGAVLSGRLVARELLGRPLGARGLDRAQQAQLLGRHRRRVLGFGVTTQVCFFVPLGAVLVMPAAVVGATMLARDVLDAPG